MKIAIKAYNNTDWLTDTDYVILDLPEDIIEKIQDIQANLVKHFAEYTVDVTLYHANFTVHSSYSEESILPEQLTKWLDIPDNSPDYIILSEDFDYNNIPDSQSLNEVSLSLYMLVIDSNSIYCKCYGKYDGSIEVFSKSINIDDLQGIPGKPFYLRLDRD